MVLLLTIVRGLVYSGCPRSCLMALSDGGHPSVSSSGPAVPIVIKKKRREGCPILTSLMVTHSRIQLVEGSKQVINHKAISLRISVCGQRELAPYAARTWRPTQGSKSPKGQRKDSGVTAACLPSDKSPNDIQKASSRQAQHGQR